MNYGINRKINIKKYLRFFLITKINLEIKTSIENNKYS